MIIIAYNDNMKKIKIISVFIIFTLAFISHNMYQWFPNSIFSILFPVNESVWEHMKLLVTPVLFFSIFEYFYYKIKEIKVNNFLLSLGIICLLGIIIYLIIYIPIDTFFGHNPIIAISLLFIVYVIMQIVSYYIMNFKKIKYGNVLGLVLIIIMYIILGYFTYNPPHINLFFDTQKKGYGIIRNMCIVK